MEITTIVSVTAFYRFDFFFLIMCVFQRELFWFFPFFWQMARVVGGALPVRMFLRTFLIPTLVSVVSFFAYIGVFLLHTLYFRSQFSRSGLLGIF